MKIKEMQLREMMTPKDIEMLGNTETAMRNWAKRHWADPAGRTVLSFADQLAKARAEIQDTRHKLLESARASNSAKLRCALHMALDLLNGQVLYSNEEVATAIEKVLRAPPRNCDVETAEEQMKRHHQRCPQCSNVNPVNCRLCFAKGLQEMYNKEKK